MPIAEPGQIVKVTGVAGSSSGKENNRAFVADTALAAHVIVVKC